MLIEAPPSSNQPYKEWGADKGGQYAYGNLCCKKVSRNIIYKQKKNGAE